MMNFWADKGVDGFPIRCVWFCNKGYHVACLSQRVFEKLYVCIYAMGPHLHDYLQKK